MKLVKYVDPSRTYIAKDGTSKPHTQIYLVLPLGDGKEKWVAIDPHFKKGSDYHTLVMFADLVIKDTTTD